MSYFPRYILKLTVVTGDTNPELHAARFRPTQPLAYLMQHSHPPPESNNDEQEDNQPTYPRFGSVLPSLVGASQTSLLNPTQRSTSGLTTSSTKTQPHQTSAQASLRCRIKTIPNLLEPHTLSNHCGRQPAAPLDLARNHDHSKTRMHR